MAEIKMTCTFELGKKLGDIPTVDVRLSSASFSRRRESWVLRLTFPAATTAGVFAEGVQEQMHCSTFVIELIGTFPSGASIDLAIKAAFEDVTALASDAADTIWVAQATQGFAGASPRISKSVLMIDGEERRLDLALRHGSRPIFLGLPAPQYEDLRRAIEEGHRPSVANLLLAQATRWGLADHAANKSAALMLAATACEVAIKGIVAHDTSGSMGTLPAALVPEDKQAPLSPRALLEHAIPLCLGRSVKEDHPGMLKAYRELTRLRDEVVHTGKQIDVKQLQPHLNTARVLIAWLEQ